MTSSGRMRIIDDGSVALRPLADESPPASVLIVDGETLGHTVPGILLEAAVDTGDALILFTTDDTPYEEVLGVHLVGKDGAPIDSLWIGGAYSTGIFQQLETDGAASVRFRFIDEKLWTITVLPEAAFRLPIVPEKKGVRRRFGFTRRLKVSSQPAG